VRSGTPVAMYSGHNGRLLCVEWSASNPDVIFTGSDDHTVRVWHVSQHVWTEGSALHSMILGSTISSPTNNMIHMIHCV